MKKNLVRPLLFMPNDIFQPSKNFTFEVKEIGLSRTPVLFVDNFYRHPEEVRKIILATPAPIWKTRPGSRNFKDYYDCRQNMRMDFGLESLTNTISALVKKFFSQEVKTPPQITTNIFRLIKDQPKNTTAFPHHDIRPNSETTKTPVNVLLFLNNNKESRGGTAFYRHRLTGLESVPMHGGKLEAFNKKYLFQPGVHENGTHYWCKYKSHWEKYDLAEMKFNRLVIFPSQLFHGAWQEGNWFKSYSRLTQVFFPQSL